jgi:hypothetical protein
MPCLAQDANRAPEPEVEPIFIIQSGAPPGFENLDVPQETLVDVSYGGHELSPAHAIFSATSFRFLDPEKVVREIPGLLHPDRVIEALSGNLAPNEDRVCIEKGVPTGCGLLDPTEAGIIFDGSRFHVEIFVGRRLLRLALINDDERLPPPSEDWTGLATLGGSVSGTSDSEPNYNFRAATLLARGATHLDFTSDVRTGGQYVVDRLYLNHDWNDWQFTGGLYRATPFRALGEFELVGFRARTSLKTRTRLYLDRAYGSRLDVFLNRRSLVQVFRDGRLLVGGVYDVGQQEIDTSELPSGAYTVEIKIQDPVSGERREQQFFAKTNDLPPLGEIQFMTEGGLIRDREDPDDPLQVTNDGLVRFASSVRVTKQLGFDVDMALIDQETVFTIGGLWLGSDFLFRTGPVWTSRGAGGATFFGAYENGPFVANVNLRGIWGETSSRYLRIPSTDFLVASAYTWKNIRFGIRGDIRQRNQGNRFSYSATPSIQIPLFRRSRLRGDLRIEYTRGDQGNIFQVKIDLVEWLRDWQFSQSVGGRYEDTNGSPNGSAEGDLRARWRSPASVAADVQADLRISRRRDRTSIAAASDIRSHRGAINSFVEQSFRDDYGPETYYGTQFSIGVIGDQSGLEALGDNAGSSAILVEIEGDYPGGVFDVFVNEVRLSRARVDQPQLIPVPPYAQYDVRISSLAGQSLDYDSTLRSVTLYPGSTARLRWTVQRVFVLIAEVVWPDGTPVESGRVTGASGEATTDENGFLQADVAKGAHLEIHVRDREDVCQVFVPENPENEDFVIIDRIVCGEPVNVEFEIDTKNTTETDVNIR